MVGKSEVKSRSVSFYVLLAAAVFVFIQTFSLLSPIVFSFLLILLVSLAVNPVISRLRALTGGRKGAPGLVAAALVVVIEISCITGGRLTEQCDFRSFIK